MVQSMERGGARQKRLILGLLWIAFFVAYLDRTNIAVAGPTMMTAFGMSVKQFGYVLAAFTAGYALTQIPGGLLADKYGAKRFLIIALLVWSLFTGLTAITASFVALIVVRFCFGVGEGLEQGAQFRAIGDTFSSSERSEASGIFLTALALGPAFVAPLAAFIIAHVGWQPLFIWLALPGLIVAAVVWSSRVIETVIPASKLKNGNRSITSPRVAPHHERVSVAGVKESAQLAVGITPASHLILNANDVANPTALAQVAMEPDATKPLRGCVELNDAYLGGERGPGARVKTHPAIALSDTARVKTHPAIALSDTARATKLDGPASEFDIRHLMRASSAP